MEVSFKKQDTKEEVFDKRIKDLTIKMHTSHDDALKQSYLQRIKRLREQKKPYTMQVPFPSRQTTTTSNLGVVMDQSPKSSDQHNERNQTPETLF